MKELEEHIALSKNEIYAERQVPKAKVLVKKLLLIPGLSLWSFDLRSGQISKVHFEQSTVKLKNELRHQFTADEHCLYIQALNRENAVRKFRKLVRAKVQSLPQTE